MVVLHLQSLPKLQICSQVHRLAVDLSHPSWLNMASTRAPAHSGYTRLGQQDKDDPPPTRNTTTAISALGVSAATPGGNSNDVALLGGTPAYGVIQVVSHPWHHHPAHHASWQGTAHRRVPCQSLRRTILHPPKLNTVLYCPFLPSQCALNPMETGVPTSPCSFFAPAAVVSIVSRCAATDVPVKCHFVMWGRCSRSILHSTLHHTLHSS